MRRVYVISILLFLINISLSAQFSNRIENNFLAVEVGDQGVTLSSKMIMDFHVKKISVLDTLLKSVEHMVNDDIWGEGRELEVSYNNGRILKFRLYKENPFLHVHTLMKNEGMQDMAISELDIANITVSVGDATRQMNVLGTGGLTSAQNPTGSFTYLMLVEPESRHSVLAAWLTQKRGVGVFTSEMDKGNKLYKMKTSLQFGNFLIRGKQDRDTDILVIGFFTDGREGLELYGEHLAKEYHIKLPKKPEVYCTWYHRNLNGSGASNETDLLKNAEYARKILAPFGLNTFQIDDHWQDSMVEGLDYRNKKQVSNNLDNGPFKTFEKGNSNFPSGMKSIAEKFKNEGFVAGIWFMPFSGDAGNSYFNSNIFAQRLKDGTPYKVANWSGTCIDATNPAGEDFLRKRFKRIYGWGYRYLKIDGLHTGAPSENIYINRVYRGGELYGKACIYDPNKTFTECFRRGLSILREEAPDAFLLGCSTTQNMSSFAPAFGMVDGMRVGPDNDKASQGDWECVTRGADYAGNLYFLNNRVWYNDPDPYYVREANPLHKARWMVSWQSIAGVMSTTSMQYEKLSAERLDLIKRGLPTHTLNARPIDILESKKPRIWMVKNERMYVVGLFNWKESEFDKIEYSFAKLGLEASEKYELFDFWGNKYLGTKSRGISEVLEAASCKVLAVRPAQSYPQVISTSRHITQGLMDIVEESWNSSSKILSGKSKVVAGDAYELRIIVPEGYQLENAKFNGKLMKILKEGRLIRINYESPITDVIAWSVEFK